MYLRKIAGVLICLCAVLVGSLRATDYYISASTGSDGNSGTSQSAPWKHAPGMNNCTGQCATKIPQPGDRFIFKLGDVWHNDSLQWNWRWSGTAAAPISVGGLDPNFANAAGCAVQTTCRAVLNADGKVITANPDPYSPVITNDVLNEKGSYVIVDTFEFTGLHWGPGKPPYGTARYIVSNIPKYVTIRNSYFHGWSHEPFNCVYDPAQYKYVCDTYDGAGSILGDTGGSKSYNEGSVVENCIFDGSDTDTKTTTAVFNWGEVRYSVFRNVVNGFLGKAVSIHDNLFEYINPPLDPTVHSNGLFIYSPKPGATVTVYNNLIRHITAATALYISPYCDTQAYFFNNIVYDVVSTTAANDTEVLTSANCGASYVPAVNLYYFNNTLQQGKGNDLGIGRGGTYAFNSVTAINNHFIVDGTAIYIHGSSDSQYCTPTKSCAGTLITSNNIVQTNAAAIAQGYNAPKNYETISATGATVDAGTDSVSQQCSVISPVLCTDTTEGYLRPQAINRPKGGWDSGAFQYEPPPAPPPTTTATPH